MTRAGWDLTEAIGAANAVLGMFELPAEEIPPAHLWHHSERLEEWFAAIKQQREDRIKGVESVPDADDDDNALVNELAKGLRD